jgi:uncharacterized protein (DUF924 family)
MWVEDVLHFWFVELGAGAWFEKSDRVDTLIRERFRSLHDQLSGGPIEIPPSPRAHLAATVVLDQFSRNMYRGSARAFAFDGKALSIARRAIELGYDRDMSVPERQFLYMPFMHSENAFDQVQCVELFSRLQDPELLRYAIEHHRIIDRFGRFPHRNSVLQRESSQEEKEFLQHHEEF